MTFRKKKKVAGELENYISWWKCCWMPHAKMKVLKASAEFQRENNESEKSWLQCKLICNISTLSWTAIWLRNSKVKCIVENAGTINFDWKYNWLKIERNVQRQTGELIEWEGQIMSNIFHLLPKKSKCHSTAMNCKVWRRQNNRI